MSEETTLEGFIDEDLGQWGAIFRQRIRDVLSRDEAGVWGDEPSEEDKGVPVLRATNYGETGIELEKLAYRQISESKKESKKLASGDLILEKSGGSADQPVGRVLYFDLEGEYYPGNFLRLLRPDRSKVNPLYLYYRLDYDYDRGATKPFQTNTTNIRNLQQDSYLNKSIPVPPFEEQRKIASVLYTVDQAIQKTEEINEQIERVKDGLMQDIFSWGISKEGGLRDPKKDKFNFVKTPVGRIPESWECVTLGKIIDRSGGFIQTGPFGTQLHQEEYVEDGIPVVMPQNIEDGKISKAEIAEITSDKADELGRHKMEPSDVIIARRGDLERASVITEREGGWICGTGCLLLRPPEKEIDGRWLQMAYQHPQSQHQINSRAVGSTMSNLNQSILESLQLALPPVGEQERIVKVLSEVNYRINTEKDNVDHIRHLKKGLMQDLLSGEVSTQDKPIKVEDEVLAHG